MEWISTDGNLTHWIEIPSMKEEKLFDNQEPLNKFELLDLD
jgi:hypothetical protein